VFAVEPQIPESNRLKYDFRMKEAAIRASGGTNAGGNFLPPREGDPEVALLEERFGKGGRPEPTPPILRGKSISYHQ